MSPPKVDPDVSRMFSRHQRIWEDALARWMSRCKGVKQELKTLRVTGGLVSDASPVVPRRRIDSPMSDAVPVGPSGLSPDAADRLSDLEDRSAKCESTIRHIQLVISDLMEAKKHGVWNNRQKQWVGLREEPKFTGKSLGRISRDEKIVVLELKGEWWRVRNGAGVEGWVHRGEIVPVLPVELQSKPGPASGKAEPEAGSATRG